MLNINNINLYYYYYVIIHSLCAEPFTLGSAEDAQFRGETYVAKRAWTKQRSEIANIKDCINSGYNNNSQSWSVGSRIHTNSSGIKQFNSHQLTRGIDFSQIYNTYIYL